MIWLLNVFHLSLKELRCVLRDRTMMGAILISFTVAVYVGLALVLFVVYPVVLRANGLSPRRWFAGAWPAIQLAFVSRSSLGTLPVTERVTVRNLGVPREYASFAELEAAVAYLREELTQSQTALENTRLRADRLAEKWKVFSELAQEELEDAS